MIWLFKNCVGGFGNHFLLGVIKVIIFPQLDLIKKLNIRILINLFSYLHDIPIHIPRDDLVIVKIIHGVLGSKVLCITTSFFFNLLNPRFKLKIPKPNNT